MNREERMKMIQEYFQQQKAVKVEIPPIITKNGNQTKIIRFNGYRCGIKFVDGFATVERSDIDKLKEVQPQLIIHEGDVK